MLRHPDDPTLWLVTPTDLRAGDVPGEARGSEGALRDVVEWAESYLTEPHPELGRDGPVCPYVRRAMDTGRLLLTVRPGAVTREEMRETVLRHRDWFMELVGEMEDERDRQHTAILVLAPDLENAERIRDVIDGTQEELKPDLVRDGLMVGEFHPLPPEKPGLHNPDFRPLRAPVPLLAIRHMVATDYAFLADRAEFMEAYLENVGDDIPPALEDAVEEAAEAVGVKVGLDADERG
jgi:hypothetical protein